jgi:hypothetical protein
VTPQEFVDAAAAVLRREGYAVEPIQLPGGPAIAGRKRPFRLRWFATQLKVTVVVAATQHVTEEMLRTFATQAFDVATRITGGLPTGLQSGIGCVPVLAGGTVDPAAAALASTPRKAQWFVGLSVPALVDLSTGQVHTSDAKLLVGAIYVPFLRRQRDLVTSLGRNR